MKLPSFKNDKKWGMLFVLADKETEERFKECARLAGCSTYREESRRISYSIDKVEGLNKSEKLSNFKRFLRYVNECCTYNWKTNNEIFVVKVEAR